MMDRRKFLMGSPGMGITAAVDCIAAPAADRIRAPLRQAVGARARSAGTVAVVIDGHRVSSVAYGNSGMPNVALDARSVFEIGSITKVLTALLLADMAQRGEVAANDPVAKYLPPPIVLRDRGRPVTLLDLACYRSGLPKWPRNFPPNWWE